MDSPGFSAKYCTYTIMDHDTNEILSMVFVDKRNVNLKSTNMEVFGFERAMDFLIGGVIVKEVVTDAHSTITALISKEPYNKLSRNNELDYLFRLKCTQYIT